MVSRSEAEALRQAQAGIRALVERDLVKFWSYLDQSNPARVATAVDAYVPLLVRRYGQDAGAFAAEWYDDARSAARIGGSFRAEALASPYEDAVDPMIRRAVGDLYAGNPAGTLATLNANVGKYVLGASRATIARATDRDPRASGWQRVTRGGACDFCRMLAARGAVYRRETVHFAAHGAGKNGGGGCNCAAVPSWDSSAPEVDVSIYEASQRMTGLRARAAAGDASANVQLAKHNALIRRAIDMYT